MGRMGSTAVGHFVHLHQGIVLSDTDVPIKDTFCCKNGAGCIPARLACDGYNNCGDWSDEFCKREPLQNDLGHSTENGEFWKMLKKGRRGERKKETNKRFPTVFLPNSTLCCQSL
jgi:hypothetical protein